MSRVQSIERAFSVLAALTDGPIGVTEVADRVDLPKSTAARMLASLAREGAVEQVPGETRYRLGPRIEALATGLVATRSLVAVARPHLVELAASNEHDRASCQRRERPPEGVEAPQPASIAMASISAGVGGPRPGPRYAAARRSSIRRRAVSAATPASRQYASAPTASPNSSFSGAPPTRTM